MSLVGDGGPSEETRPRPAFGWPIHPDDLESQGHSVLRVAGVETLREVGEAIWVEWSYDIEQRNRHPSKRYLAAFLRGWSGPAGGWMPDGMAEYWGDRIDPTIDKPMRQGGRPPRRTSELAREFSRKAPAALAVARRIADGQPKAEAIASVASALGENEVYVKLAFHRYGAHAQWAVSTTRSASG